jgi:2-C-methyl-D-erythritol 4-phosphate cytidylyltransferase
MNPYVIIVAGGKGVRMQSNTPKQFLDLNGLPVMMHTMMRFDEAIPGIGIVVVLPRNHVETWKNLCIQHSFTLPHVIAEGGPTRFHSVKSGLQKITETDVVIGVHDAVRPLVAKEVITRCYEDASFYGNAVPVLPIGESLRERMGVSSRPLKREHYVLVQTPQCFKDDLLKNAYLQNYIEEFTDDAGVVEADGHQIHLVTGNPENIKITSPSDLIIASVLLNSI